MTVNAVPFWTEVAWVGLGALALLLFALAIGLRHRPTVMPGMKGHRDREDEGEHEEIQPDGYIDSFAGVIEEAGGGLPPVVKLALPTIVLWWLIYLIVNWTK